MQIETNPLQRFADLFAKMQKTDVQEPAAVTLATATSDGKPSARVVLLKGFDENGFVFYTNLASRKAIELRDNPFAALCFYWEPVHYQVRIEGAIQILPDIEADEYFATRPRGSQIGAWASKQSSAMQSRDELALRFEKYERKFDAKPVTRPPFWSGFRLMPEHIEFWHRQDNRLHERDLYTKNEDSWEIRSLYP